MLEALREDRIDHKKPRHDGMTYIIDKFQGLDKENFETIASYIDMVKIYGAFPLLLKENSLVKRIDFYHSSNVLVSIDSTLAEFAIREKAFEKFLESAKRIGFNLIGISENSINLSFGEKKKIIKILDLYDMRGQWKIGNKDPRRQLSVKETVKKMNEILQISQEKIILESNLGYNVGIYDEKGDIKWSLLLAITSKISPNSIIFETHWKFNKLY